MKGLRSFVAIAGFAATSAFAVYGIHTGSGSSDSTYVWVGQAGGASGVIIAPNWVITAQHVGGTSFTLNGVTYTADRVVDNAHYDLHLMHFPAPFAGHYNLFTGNPVGKLVTFVGYGDTGALRGDGLGFDDVGFGGTRRTATNIIGDRQILSYNGWDTPSVICDNDPPVGNGFSYPYNRDWFGDGPATPDEGGLMGGDSGGGWFINVNGVPRLVGVSNYIFYDDGVSGGDPNPYFAFGISGTSGADLSNFQVQRWIMRTIHPLYWILPSSIGG